MRLKETECEGVDWIKVAPLSVLLRDLVNTVMNIRIS
jgi:hypothetical protein